MKNQSAGILLYRLTASDQLQVFLVHPGGPFWKNKDENAWSIPKGEYNEEEEPLAAAIREFKEETGHLLKGDFIELDPVKQKGGKIVRAFALNRNIDPASVISNHFEIEWPPRSGKQQSFPEIDKAEWFDIQDARQKINTSQAALLDQLLQLLQSNS